MICVKDYTWGFLQKLQSLSFSKNMCHLSSQYQGFFLLAFGGKHSTLGRLSVELGKSEKNIHTSAYEYTLVIIK